MIPRTSSGRGFKGAAAYYLHDKGASTSDRVHFTHTLNLANDNPRRAIAEMIYTSEHAAALKAENGIKATGRKLEKPVYTFSLSWHPSENPTIDQMKEAGLSALRALKMDHHQVLMVAHNDTDHPHVHLIVNRIDPDTGKAHGLNKDHLVLSKWAEKYEREFGHTWCTERVKNNTDRQQAAIDKAKGLLDSAFVKNLLSQARDKRPEYDRRAKAIAAKRAARAAQQDARQSRAGQRANEAARADAKQNRRELYRAPEIVPPHDSGRAAAAFAAQQAEDRKRAAFDAWQIDRINALQDRHNEQRDSLAKVYEQRKAAAAARIEDQYGASRRAHEARLAQLADRTAHGSRLSKLIDRVRGSPDERQAVEKTLANIAQRSAEMLGAVARQERAARDHLQQQHAMQLQEQSLLFERQLQAGYVIPEDPARVRARQGPLHRDPDQDRGGPDLG